MRPNNPKVRVSFQPVLDKKGNVLNPEVLSKTAQSEKDSVDINRIMKNHLENGGLIGNPFRNPLNKPGEILDLTQFSDFRTMKTRVIQAEQIFMVQTPEVRNRFNNDAQSFFEFLMDSKNDEEAVKLGLKHEDVLKTALADDGKTKILPSQRKALDEAKKLAEAKAAAGASGTGA